MSTTTSPFARLGLISDDWFTPKRFFWILSALIFVAYPDVMLGSHTFFHRDFGCFTYPSALYQRESFWRGEIPLWNPYCNSGIPFAAQWNTIVFYPLALFYVIVPMPWAVGYFCLGHLLLAGMGMYFLAHRWTGNRFGATVAGLAFALNGLMIHSLMWASNLAAIAWMPLVILAVEQGWRRGGRTLLLAVLAGATQMLSGAPEFILFTWCILVVLAAGDGWRAKLGSSPSFRTEERGMDSSLRIMVRFLAMVAMVAGLAALQLLPFFDLLTHSQRDIAFGDNGWAMPRWGWANFLVPLYHTSPSITGVYTQTEQQWTSSYYAGIVTLVLAMVAVRRSRSRRVWFFGGITALGVLLAMGDDGLILPVMKKVIPQMGFMRYPIKFVGLTLFAVPVLSAFGVRSLLVGSPEERQRSATLFCIGCVSAMMCIAVVLWDARLRPASGELWATTLQNGIDRTLFLLVMLGFAFTLTGPGESRAAGAGRLGLVLLLGFDLVTHSGSLSVIYRKLLGVDLLAHLPSQNPTVITQAFEPGAAKSRTAMPKLGEARVMISRPMHQILEQAGHPNALNYCLGCRRAAFADWNLVDAIPKVNGFYSLHPREEAEATAALYGATNEVSARFADFLGVSKISNMQVLFSWNERSTPLPVVTIGQKPVFTHSADALTALKAGTFEPAQVVYLPKEAQDSAAATQASAGRIVTQEFLPQEVRASVVAEKPAWVVVAQTYYHHWRAYVDGKPTRLWNANFAYQALETPAGSHEIRLVYVDRNFQAGLVVSLGTLAGMIVAWIRNGREAT
jgi:hypothetical protein